MRRFLFFIIFLVLISSAVFAEVPTLQKYVNDYANVLTATEEAELNSLAALIEENTTVEIAILTVNNLEGMSIEQYAVEAFEKSGIGKGDVDNGLLIMAAIEDREWRFEVGYGLEGILNDAKVGLIGRTYMTPAFVEGEYGQGFYDAVDAVFVVIQNGGDTSFISDQVDQEEMISIIFSLLFALIPLFFFLSAVMPPSEKCPDCGSKMKCKPEGDYYVCECPKCKKKVKKKRKKIPFWLFFFTGSGGGRSHGGGFGGGRSGGGGASGGW
ncbi:MAG: TPM domain-containing protein [Candidatus Aenigmarchaeota archaeon]|nr:TPM domain-containing protein [Candidatus Aenigmarchaeota archaeon]